MNKLLTILILIIGTHSFSQSLSQLHIDNGKIRDENGRTIILNGCVTITHNSTGFQPYTPDDYKRLKSWGANYQSIRLFASTIGADGSTTFPITYQALDSMVSRAKQVGIYTEFKLTMYGGATPYDWDNLWLDSLDFTQNLIDGWKSVWTRYVNEPAIVGYDLINEPEQGDLTTTTDSIFICDYLNPMYQTLIDTLQSIDTNKFALIQPALDEFDIITGTVDYYNYPCSINRDKILYAPHFYIKISYPYDSTGYTARINRLLSEAQTHNAPLFIGEYGIPWNSSDDGNTVKELQYEITEKIAVAKFDSLMIGFSRPWFADDNAQASPQLNWALIKGTAGLDGNERSFITNSFSRPYPRATAGELLDYRFHYSDSIFQMTYMSNTSLGNTEIFTAKSRYYPDSLILRFNNSCFYLDTISNTFQVINNPAGINLSNISWNAINEIITINEWQNGTNTIEIRNNSNCISLGPERIEEKAGFRIYPNPSKEKITLEFDTHQESKIFLYNINGNHLKTFFISGKTLEIDISSLYSGVFYLKLENGVTKKVIKYN